MQQAQEGFQMNKVQLVGRIGQNPEVRYTQSGAAVCDFSLATRESWKDKSGQWQEITTWHKIQTWSELAEKVGTLKKGNMVFVEGKLKLEEWQTKEGEKRSAVKIVAQAIYTAGFIKSGEDEPRHADAPNHGPRIQPNQNQNQGGYTEEDIPF